MVTVHIEGDEVVWVAADGTVTAAAVEEFTHHSCYLLAWELSGLSGWQMMAVAADQGDGTTLELDWVHVGVLTPSGDVLDVEGVRGVDEWLSHWGDDVSFMAAKEGALDNPEYEGYLVPREQFTALLHLEGDKPATAAFTDATTDLARHLLATMPAYQPFSG